MHGRNRKLYAVAVAALVSGGLISQRASATTVPYSTGFETTDGFATGDLSTQGAATGWYEGVGSDTNHSSGVIETTTTYASSGQALQLNRAAPYTTPSVNANPVIAYSPLFANATAASGQSFSVSTEINYTATGVTASDMDGGPFGPVFGIEINGPSTGVGNPNVSLGSLTVDATTGNLIVDDGSGTYDTVSATTLTAGDWYNLTLTVVDTGSGFVLDSYLNGVLVGDASNIASVNSVSAYTQGYLFGAADSGEDAGAGTAYFDNYSAEANVPEPTSMAVLGLAAIGLVGRRARRSFIA